MASFSIEQALGAGFRLIRREPKAVLLWGLAYIAFYVVIEVLMLGPMLQPMMEALKAGGSPDAFSALTPDALTGPTLALLPLVYLVSIVATIVFYCAVFRAELHPDDRRYAYFRFSQRELWTGLSSVAWFLMFSIGLGLVLVLAGVVLGLATNGFKANLAPALLVLGAPLLAGVLYVGARLGMTGLLAYDRSRFIFVESWAFTRGQGWRLVLLSLGLIFLVLIVFIGLALVFAILAGLLFLLAKVAGVVGTIIAVVIGIAGLIAYTLSMGPLYAVMIAPYAQAYRELRDSGAAA